VRSSGYVAFALRRPEHFAERFAAQLPPGTLDAAELHPRTVRIIATLPAEKPRLRSSYHHCSYAPSAQLAIERAMFAAQFGAATVADSLEIEAPLPEPVRISVVPLVRPEGDQ
jgi:hypothetical protein